MLPCTGILINTSSREGDRDKEPQSLTFNLNVEEAEPSDTEEPELRDLQQEEKDGDTAVSKGIPPPKKSPSTLQREDFSHSKVSGTG